jgi:hypothetical protein
MFHDAEVNPTVTDEINVIPYPGEVTLNAIVSPSIAVDELPEMATPFLMIVVPAFTTTGVAIPTPKPATVIELLVTD